ncbi:MAG TPA: hypothetical protein VML55_05100 [Planctomycetaceae bacterium]|nr:hypothetical protein [Planctomycetaceae bacterium]
MKRGVSLEAARAAKQRAADVCSALVGDEVAVGITRVGDDGFGLKVNLTSDPGGDIQFPDEVEGVPVQVEVVGRIRKQ